MLFLYNNTNVQNSFWLTLKVRLEKLAMVMPVGILQCYLIVYWLIPKFLLRKKYTLFFCGVFISSVAVIFFVDILTYKKFDFLSVWMGVASYISRAGPVFCLIFIMIKMLKTWYLKEREKDTLLKENLNAELQLLKAQVHPHFLFNTLNNIYSFILSDAAKAQSHVKKFEEMLRYMITECDQPFVALSKEINMINDYAALEKVRYGNRLDMEIVITGDHKNKMIAPLLMIPFVENSFKHGTSQMLRHPWVKLEITCIGNQLFFNLSNSKPSVQIATKQTKGIGLVNVKKRLTLLYPGKHQLDIDSTDDSFVVNMQIMLEEESLLTKNKIAQPEKTIAYA
jgi:sensor histidine kinase YesM